MWCAAHAQARSQKPSPSMDPWGPEGLGPLGPEGTWALGSRRDLDPWDLKGPWTLRFGKNLD
jgi:hypothetical protein